MDPGEGTPPRPVPSQGHASEHLANERTFLAWVRTALALIGLGFVLARMGLFLRLMDPAGASKAGPEPHGAHEFLFIGAAFLLIGTVACACAGQLYHRTRLAIDLGRYEPPRRAVATLTAVVVLGGLVLAGVLLWRVVLPAG